MELARTILVHYVGENLNLESLSRNEKAYNAGLSFLRFFCSAAGYCPLATVFKDARIAISWVSSHGMFRSGQFAEAWRAEEFTVKQQLTYFKACMIGLGLLSDPLYLLNKYGLVERTLKTSGLAASWTTAIASEVSYTSELLGNSLGTLKVIKTIATLESIFETKRGSQALRSIPEQRLDNIKFSQGIFELGRFISLDLGYAMGSYSLGMLAAASLAYNVYLERQPDNSPVIAYRKLSSEVAEQVNAFFDQAREYFADRKDLDYEIQKGMLMHLWDHHCQYRDFLEDAIEKPRPEYLLQILQTLDNFFVTEWVSHGLPSLPAMQAIIPLTERCQRLVSKV